MDAVIQTRGDVLPFEPRTAFAALAMRRHRLLALGAAAAVAGALCGRALVRDSYEAECVLFFAPLAGDEAGLQLPRLESRRHMVKLRPNLEEVIRRRGLKVSAWQLGSVCDARVQRDSNMLAVRAVWSTAAMAAHIANDLADVFLENQTAMRRFAAERQVAELERRQERALAAQKSAAAALKRFRLENDVTNLDDQIRGSLADVSALQAQLHQARIDQQNIAQQRKNLDQILKSVQSKLPAGALQFPTGQTSADLTVKLQRLRTAIEDDRTERERRVVLERARAELARSQRSAREGLVSVAELQRVETAYERAKELAEDTPQTREWKAQARTIEKALSEQTAAPAGPPVAPDVALRVLQFELDGAGIEEKVSYLDDAVAKAQARQSRYPSIQREYADLQAQSSRYEREVAALESPLGLARRVLASKSPDFVSVARAVPPFGATDHRRIAATLGLGMGLTLLCLALMAAREVFEPNVRSARELEHFTELPVWAQVPAKADPDNARAVHAGSVVDRMFRLSRRVGQPSRKRGSRVMITGTASPSARQRAVSALIAQYVLQNCRVAWISLIDEQRAEAAQRGGEAVAHPSLRDYLSDESIPQGALLESDMRLGAVYLGGTGNIAPRLRASARMRNLLTGASERFDVVLIVADSMLVSPDERALAEQCDAVVLVAQAQKTSRLEARRLAGMARDTGVQTCGWMLLEVPDAFVPLEPERSW